MTPYAARRARLAAAMEPGAVAVLATSPEVARNSDSDYPYRHDSYFYYMTGFTEPEAVLVLVAAQGGAPSRSILFCREKNVEREIWDGFRHGPAAAKESFGFDEAYPIGELDTQMARLLADVPVLYYAIASNTLLEQRVADWLKAVRAQSRSGVSAPAQTRHLLALLDEMRLLKDESEQALMLRSATIAGAAHVRAMRAARPGMFEYELEAELLYEFTKNGARFPAYAPIVASGANACVLHYSANNAQTRDGDLVLIDAGCEFDSYASDITRTFPVNGRFSEPQKLLYELVLRAQQAALAAVVPGRPYSGVHEAALAVLADGMLELGLLDRARYGSVENVLAERAYTSFYMHGTGHWLGLDVHDTGSYRDLSLDGKPSRLLAPGMALTVEPGIYVRPAPEVPEHFWGIGIRIEDDVVVGASGAQVLSSGAPKTVRDIETLMAER